MQTLTDLREYRRGKLPDDFSPLWAGTATAWVDGVEYDTGTRNRFQVTQVGSGTLSAWSWPTVYSPGGGAPGSVDQRVLFRIVSLAPSGSAWILAVAASGVPASESAYLLKVTPGIPGTVAAVRRLAGAETVICSASINAVVGSWYHAKLTLTGPKTLAISLWEELGTEPGSPLASATDAAAALADGYVAIPAGTIAQVIDHRFWSVGTGTDAALPYSALPRGMDAWSRDPSAMIEFTAEIDGFIPADSRQQTLWISSVGRHTPANDFPAAVNIPPGLADAGTVSADITKDIQFQSPPALLQRPGTVALPSGSDQAAASTAQSSSPLTGDALERVTQLALNNGRGKFNYLIDWSLAGRMVCVRAGELGSPYHRAFEPIYTALMADEPEIGNVVAIPLAAKLAALGQNLKRNAFLGIPTCITNPGGTSAVNTPGNPAQDLLTFTAMVRFRCHGLMASFGAVFWKALGAANQFTIAITPSSSPTPGRVQVTAAPGLSFTLPPRVDDDVWHDVVFALLDAQVAYVMLDGILLGPFGINVSVTTGGNVSLAYNLMVDVVDARLYSKYLQPPEALAASYQVIDPATPGLVGYWRCDDLTGLTVTDYSSTASHGTLVNVAGQPAMAFSPSDLGEAALAGKPMPIAAGALFNAPVQRIDSARERWMLSDGAIPGVVQLGGGAGLNAVLKSQGFGLAPAVGSPISVASATVGANDSGGAGLQLVTVITATAHGLSAFLTVVLAGATPAGLNGAQIITATPSTTKFTFLVANGLTPGAASGAITVTREADWTDAGDGVAAMAGGLPQPGTFDLVGALGGNASSQLVPVAQALLAARGSPSIASPLEVDGNAFESLRRQIPYDGGFYSDQAVTADKMLQDLLGGSLAHFRHDRSGRLVPAMLYPPLTPGPYGLEPCLEFGGYDSGAISWMESGSPAASTVLGSASTILFWMKLHHFSADASFAGVLFFPPWPPGHTIIDTVNDAATAGIHIGISAIDGRMIFATPGVTNTQAPGIGNAYSATPPGWFAPDTWYLVACQIQTSGGGATRRQILAAPLGAAGYLSLIAADYNVAGSVTPTSGRARFAGGAGGMCGSITQVAAFSALLTSDQLKAYLTAKPTASDTSITWLSPLNEGYRQNTVKELISGRQGSILGGRWCPRFVFDLRTKPVPAFGGVKRLKPTWHAEIGYAKNWHPITSEGDIAGSVTGSPRWALKEGTSRIQIFDNTTRTAFQLPREIVLQSPLASAVGAQALMQILLGRLAPGRLAAQLAGAGFEALPLQVTDEAWVFSSLYHHQAGRAYRVIAPSAQLSARKVSLGLWGGSGTAPQAFHLVIDSNTGDILQVDATTGDVLNVQ